tara:strand:+ start:216 stop:443 length:228 start_codon:yes stop_codon:yes gene_type:complete
MNQLIRPWKRDYYLREHHSNRVSELQEKQLLGLELACGLNYDKYHKYQTEYVIHHWLPPVEYLPPRDNSIEGLII